jgi:hypothetical protein
MRTILLGICVFIASIVYGQAKCGSYNYSIQLKASNPILSQKEVSVEHFIRQAPYHLYSASGSETGYPIIKIPVVVHIVYKTPSQNISDSQIISQIDALNRDYRRRNADSVNTPARFKSVASDTRIEFELATADPTGRVTNGIVHKQTKVEGWSMDDKIKYSKNGGDDVWDSRYYLNIWVGDLHGALGYSTFPGSDPDKDGVVIDLSVFGTFNVNHRYNMGRTAVHEIGHWLSLKHIWGDTYCGDDLVDDTPKQGNFTPGCPGAAFRSSCDNGTLGDMYMNYMDFTDDACMNLFTEGQRERMVSLFQSGGPRETILSSRGLDKPWVFTPLPETQKEQDNETITSSIFPNPASGSITLNLPSEEGWVGKYLRVADMSGNAIITLLISSKNQKINIESLKPGVYFIYTYNGSNQVRQRFIKM